jgi:hypothetical protein
VNSVTEIYKKLCNLSGVVPHSQVMAHPKDIDLYVPIERMATAKELLKQHSYVCINDLKGHSIYCKYTKNELYIFDLCCDYNYYFNLYPRIRLSENGNAALGNDINLNRCVKQFSRDGQCNDVNSLVLNQFFRNSENFHGCLGKKYIKNDDIQFLSSILSKNSRFPKIKLRFRILASSIGSGKSFAFVGPDGSGKGFFIEQLKKVDSVKVIYMGDWFFRLQTLYSLLIKLPSPFNRFLYFFYYFENIIRRIRVAFWVILGKTVFIDGFPGTNTPITLTGIPGFINKLIFRLTPKPDLFLILQARPHVVFARKQELEISQIHAIQIKQKQMLASYPHVIVNTEELEESLNSILGIWYEN